MKLITLIVILFNIALFSQVRIKDMAKIGNLEAKQLVGYGIVTGLDGTGDGTRSMFTVQSVANMLEHFGIKVDKKDLKPKNVAAVMVMASLPSYGKKGTAIDVTVSSLGDAKSLQGGNLLITPLTDPLSDSQGEVYVMASGPISIGGFNAGGNDQTITKNYTLVGRIPDGGNITTEVGGSIIEDGKLSLYLNSPDYTTAVRASKSINNFLGEEVSYAVDKAEIVVALPKKYQTDSKAMEFIAFIENVEVNPDEAARIVVNERTGTIVIGDKVKIDPVAISHGNLSIKISSTKEVVQPDPFTLGTTDTQQNAQTNVEEEMGKVISLSENTTLKDLVDSLNELGVTPRDMISIFQSLKEAGALRAELILI
ncbi:MAG: flagellar basal body P-ring protein FlgI [Candidatus Delongbacteria bacterium]|nr:flagellar basal body P-ring protein FlgI [Candidatus Delongbacteria bacterium]MBN2833900.1 flagellar basal body P-ring protein FlgI [Candidatus Delongbacteria bacterium]